MPEIWQKASQLASLWLNHSLFATLSKLLRSRAGSQQFNLVDKRAIDFNVAMFGHQKTHWHQTCFLSDSVRRAVIGRPDLRVTMNLKEKRHALLGSDVFYLRCYRGSIWIWRTGGRCCRNRASVVLPVSNPVSCQPGRRRTAFDLNPVSTRSSTDARSKGQPERSDRSGKLTRGAFKPRVLSGPPGGAATCTNHVNRWVL